MQTRFLSRIPKRRSSLMATMAMIVAMALAANTVRPDSPATNRNSVGMTEALTPVTPPFPLKIHTEAVEVPSTAKHGGMSANVTPGFTASFFDGDIAEVILYDRNLTDQERLQEENYLQSKYNLGGFTTPGLPVLPDGLVAGDPSSTSVTLSWNPSSGAAGIVGYQIYLNGVLYASCTGTSIVLTGLAAGDSYEFTVVAVDSLGRISSESTAVGVTTTEAWPYASDPYGDADGDTIPNYEDAQPDNPEAGIMTVTILSPANGSTIP